MRITRETIVGMALTMIATIGDEAEAALLAIAEVVTLLTVAFERGPVRMNQTTMVMGGVEASSAVANAQKMIGNADAVLVPRIVTHIPSAHATVLRDLILGPDLPSRGSHPMPRKIVPQNWPPCSRVPRAWKWNGNSG